MELTRTWAKGRPLSADERSRQLRTRFDARVDRSGDCWVWTSRVDPDGYGLIDFNGDKRAHRVAYELAYGVAPGKACVCHRCDNRRCVRPDHLFLGSSEENTADRNAKGRQARGERQAHAKLTESQIWEIRDLLSQGWRQVDVAARFGICQPNVSVIKRRAGWRHVA